MGSPSAATSIENLLAAANAARDAGGDDDRGWGRRDETWRVLGELRAYGVEPSWFSLGDLDLGTHLVRSQMLAACYPLSEVTEALCSRWLAAAMSTVRGSIPMTCPVRQSRMKMLISFRASRTYFPSTQ